MITCVLQQFISSVFLLQHLFFVVQYSLALFSISSYNTTTNLITIVQQMTELCYLLQMRKFFLKNAALLHCSNLLFSSKALPLGLFCILYCKTKFEKDQRKNERVLLFAANAEMLLQKNAAFLQHSCSKTIFGSKIPPGIVQHLFLHHQTKFEEDQMKND